MGGSNIAVNKTRWQQHPVEPGAKLVRNVLPDFRVPVSLRPTSTQKKMASDEAIKSITTLTCKRVARRSTDYEQKRTSRIRRDPKMMNSPMRNLSKAFWDSGPSSAARATANASRKVNMVVLPGK
ncbi:MAG: hypothetical protein WD898_03175 [Candidatus Paceibacterota bacterium]